MLHSTNHSPHCIAAPKFMTAYKALNLSSPQITFKKTSFKKKKNSETEAFPKTAATPPQWLYHDKQMQERINSSQRLKQDLSGSARAAGSALAVLRRYSLVLQVQSFGQKWRWLSTKEHWVYWDFTTEKWQGQGEITSITHSNGYFFLHHVSDIPKMLLLVLFCLYLISLFSCYPEEEGHHITPHSVSQLRLCKCSSHV